jgi:hypothetical protein
MRFSQNIDLTGSKRIKLWLKHLIELRKILNLRFREGTGVPGVGEIMDILGDLGSVEFVFEN